MSALPEPNRANQFDGSIVLWCVRVELPGLTMLRKRSVVSSDQINHVAYLYESNICSLFSETLSADVEAILSDETSFVGADAAMKAN